MRAIPIPVRPERLDDLYTRQKLTDQQIVDLLVSEGHDATLKRVRSWRKRHGIATVPRWSRHDVPPIEGRLRSLLVGSMLGDGRLVRRTHATHYEENHSEGQRGYLEWKVAQWGAWVEAPPKPVDWETMGGVYPGVRFHTVAHAALNEWQALFYADRKKGWKRLIPGVVDYVDEFALAVWYLDDGYAGWWPDITFGADRASRAVAHLIFEKFDLQPRWQPKVGNTGCFHMEREETAERFLSMVRPHVPECMKYKIEGFGYQQSRTVLTRRKLDPEVLREMAGRGVPIRRMARELGVGAATVDRHLRKHGIEHPRLRGNPLHREGGR
jgi:hypothetical protein